MYLEVRPNGARYWRQKYRFNGKEKLLALGVVAKSLAVHDTAILKNVADLLDSISVAKKSV